MLIRGISFLNKIIDSLIYLVYPYPCGVCGELKDTYHHKICSECFDAIQKFEANEYSQNKLKSKLNSLFSFQSVHSLYTLEHKSIIHHILHNIKYENNQSLAYWLGEQIADEISRLNIQRPHYIIPVPLHPKKKLLRGYNQSELIADGISQKLKIPTLQHLLYRKVMAETQTKKGRDKRFLNVLNAFSLGDGKVVANKHILLIDDAITTGATIYSCAIAFNEIENISISVFCVASGTLD